LLQLLISTDNHWEENGIDVTNEVKRRAFDLAGIRLGGQCRRPNPPSGYNYDVLQHRNSAQGQPLPEEQNGCMLQFQIVAWNQQIQ
jgi:hypothetical protein